MSSVLISPPPKDTAFFEKRTGRISSVWLSWLNSVTATAAIVQTLQGAAAIAEDNSTDGNSGAVLSELFDALSQARDGGQVGHSPADEALLEVPSKNFQAELDELRGLLAAGDPPGYGPESFDAAGTAAALGALYLQIANNLSDLASAATARTNLGLGTAAVQNSTAFDAAGVAAAAIAALLAGSNTWNGALQTINSNITLWGELVLKAAGMDWSAATIYGNGLFTGDMHFPYSNGFWYASPNATGWFEFRVITSQGGSLAADFLGWQYNTRTTIGGTDVWLTAFQLNSVTGLLTFFTTATFSVAPVFSDQPGTRAALGLTAAAIATPAALTESTSSVLTITGGAAALLAATSIQVKQSSASVSGYLSSADWTTFNAKQAALGAYAAWTPTYSGSGSMTVAQTTLNDAQFVRVGPLCHFKFYAVLALGGTASNQINVSLPLAAVGSISPLTVLANVGSNFVLAEGWVNGASMNLFLNAAPNFTLGSVTLMVSGSYRVS